MNDFQNLQLNGKNYTKRWILENFKSLDSQKFTENELKTLSFCGQWLSGAKQFKVPTSGSTGKSKSIVLSREQMILSAHMTARALKLNAGDRALVCLSPSYIGGLMMLARGLELGWNLTVVEPANNPFASFDMDKPALFDFTALVPLQLQTLIESGGYGLFALNKMKAILVGGAEVSPVLFEKVQQIEAPIYQTFGMTETASHIALRKLNGPDFSEMYKTMPGVEIGQDSQGCLTIKSQLTNDELITTNDRVALKSKDRFIWLGRIDNVINSGGVKVQAEKVEKAIAQALHEIDKDKKAEFFVGGLPDKKFGEVVVAVFEGCNFSQEFLECLSARLLKKISKYEVPKQFYTLDGFTRTPTGKIDRKASLQRLLALWEHLTVNDG